MAGEIGKVIHYYDKLGVAIVELTKALKEGETIKFEHGEESFEQSVSSMQIDHESAASAKKGDSVGIKVDQKVKEGATVSKVG